MWHSRLSWTQVILTRSRRNSRRYKRLLNARSARSEISSQFIQQFTSPVTDYAEIIQIVPGTFTINTNGVGLGQATTSFRGFQDGEYDITWDSIPFQDTNTPSPPLLGLLSRTVDRWRRLRPQSRFSLYNWSHTIWGIGQSFIQRCAIAAGPCAALFPMALSILFWWMASMTRAASARIIKPVCHSMCTGLLRMASKPLNYQTRNAGDIKVSVSVLR